MKVGASVNRGSSTVVTVTRKKDLSFRGSKHRELCLE
jgi:hypothetical protein